MTQRWQPWLVGLVFLAGCTGEAGVPGGGPAPIFVDGDAGTVCAHPEEGCACDPQQPPIDCYLDAVLGEDGRLTCSRGTRYCRGEVWTGCESVRTYQLRSGPGVASLVTGPTACNPCDPACAVHRDIPSSADLPGSSTGLGYDPTAGGIGLVPTTTGTGTLTDSDGDGVPDVADDCPGPGVVRRADGTCSGADEYFYHELPYGGPAEIDPLDIMVQVRTADVYFLMDTTGSMGEEIYNLRTGLTSGTFIPGCSGGIIGAIRCTIPDAWFGVGYHDDYPVSPYGGTGDYVYRNLQNITSSVSAAQTAVNSLALHWGNDGPESQTQALWAIANGGGLGPYLAAAPACAAGHWGYPCFRPGTIPIVILFTDAPFHNGPYGYNYAFGASLPSTTWVSGNDTFASARYIGDAATTWTGWAGDTSVHANNYSASCAWGGSVYGGYSRDVVFRFDVSVTRTITIDMAGSSYDTLISLRNSSGTEIACDEDGNPDLTSRMVVTLGPGTYYLIVMGWYTSQGVYRLSIGNPAAATTTGYPVTWAQTVSELNRTNMRVITVHSGGTYGLDDARALADATGSYSSTGARYVFSIPSNGSGLSTAVVDAVRDLANYNRMDISARAVDNTATAIDERGFVDSITAVSWGPGSCSGISGGSVFVQCLPGTSVDFRVAFRNDIVMPTTVPQVFTFWIEVLGDGTYVLARIPVRIVVPADVPLYPPSGSYWQEYDSDDHCAATERPDWNTLSWDIASLPAGTSVRWELRTAETLAALGTVTPVTFTVPTATSPADVGARLVSAGQNNYLRFLRVTAVLLSNPERTQTPVLRSFELRYTCIPQE